MGTLTCLLSIVALGHGMAIQQNIAQDVTAEITDVDLDYSHDVVRQCFADSAPESIDEHQAFSVNGRTHLTVIFDWHEHNENRKARYSASLSRENQDDPWKLLEIKIHGEQRLPGRAQAISFSGNLDAETVREVIDHTERFWTKSAIGRVRPVYVSTNAMPHLNCEPDDLGNPPAKIVYGVTITSLDVPTHVSSSTGEAETFTIASSGPNSFSIRLARDQTGKFVTTDVDCAGSGNSCDPTMLAKLKENLEAPSDPMEATKRMDAAMAILPEAFDGAQVVDSNFGMIDSHEFFIVTLGDTPISEYRSAQSFIYCARPAGSDEEWRCQHNVSSISQKVSGQSLPIHLHLRTISEPEFERLIVDLKHQLIEHPAVAPSDNPIEIRHINTDGNTLAGSFIQERSFYDFTFDYDDAPVLKSVVLRKRFNSDWTQIER